MHTITEGCTMSKNTVAAICLACITTLTAVNGFAQLSPDIFRMLPWIAIYSGAWRQPDIPAPTIKYGEFPFRLVYSIDGEIFVVEDIYVAEFEGFGWNVAHGHYRMWNGYIAGTGEDKVPVLVDGNKRIYFSVGSARYYMDDEFIPFEEPFVPMLLLVEWLDIGGGGTSISAPENLGEIYNIELIEWELSSPIVNSFVD